MKCTNCGCELEEGHLYCEACGQEIRIVPDFDPEVENRIYETLTTMVEDVSDSLPVQEKRGHARRGRRWLLWLCVGAAALLAAVLAWRGVCRYRDGSYDYQVKQARSRAAAEDYDGAVRYLTRAIELREDDIPARLLLAEYARLGGDREGAEAALLAVLARSPENEEACERLIGLYEEAGDYEAIGALLEESSFSELRERYSRYLALAPEFSEAEGSYTEVVALKLSSNTSGSIYYTLDGSRPTETSARYTTPILLENGEYRVSAVFVNEYGRKSPVVTRRYNIEVAVPLAPEVPCMSGSYDRPTMIEVKAAPGESVYYTMDGSEPTLDSIPYSVPIAMPLGSSTFRFIAYSQDGIASEITQRTYVLQVATAIDVGRAVQLLMQALKDRGVILEFDGSLPGRSGKNIYIASTLIRIGENNFFLVAEYYQDTLGTLTRTGTLYGVEADSGAVYRVTTDDRGNYLANPY